jgi:YD repeat-containing protein
MLRSGYWSSTQISVGYVSLSKGCRRVVVAPSSINGGVRPMDEKPRLSRRLRFALVVSLVLGLVLSPLPQVQGGRIELPRIDLATPYTAAASLVHTTIALAGRGTQRIFGWLHDVAGQTEAFAASNVQPAVSSATPSPPPTEVNQGGSSVPTSNNPATRQEIKTLRQANTKVFADTDGTYEAEIHAGPIHFKGSDDSWKEIDNSLVPASDGNGFENKASDLRVEFASSGSSPALITETLNGKSFSFGFQQASDVAPIVSGNEITYPNIFPSMDLKFQVIGYEVKELLILRTQPHIPAGPLDLRIPLTTKGLAAEKVGDQVKLKDGSGSAIFSLPPLYMFDSSTSPATGDGSYSNEVSLSLESSGNRTFMHLVADGNWLRSAQRVYPVTIDPTTLPDKMPTNDTYVQSAPNAGTVFPNNATELKVGSYDGSTAASRSFLKFDLGELPPEGTIKILDATLKLWETATGSPTCSAPTDAKRILEYWGSQVTWNNKPILNDTAADTQWNAKGPGCGGAGPVTFQNLESMVDFWKSTPAINYGVALRAPNEDSAGQWKKFASADDPDGSKQPVLHVKYNYRPMVPSDLGVTSSVRPTFSARYQDQNLAQPAKLDDGAVEFEIYPKGTTCPADYYPDESVCSKTRLQSGTGPSSGTVASGTQVTWTASADLSYNTEYMWRARGNDYSQRDDTSTALSATGPWTELQTFRTPTSPAPTLGGQNVAQSDEHGLEQFYPYRSFDLGVGTSYVQLHRGNLVVQTPDVRIPGYGLDAIISHTYNSGRNNDAYHDSGLGRGWTLSLADLEGGLDGESGGVGGLDLNSPLSIVDFAVDASGHSIGTSIDLTDGDGTAHRFVRRGGINSPWESPPGLDLQLQEIDDQNGLPKAYRFVRPDGVYYEATRPVPTGETAPAVPWHITAIRERDGGDSQTGNWLKFEYRRVTLSANQSSPLGDLRLSWVTHRRRTAPVACIRYDDQGNIQKIISLPDRGPAPGPTSDPDSDCVTAAAGAGQVTDSRVTEFTVDPLHHLSDVTQNAQTSAALGKRTVAYAYDSPALPSPLDYGDLLTGVTDARNHQTGFAYGEFAAYQGEARVKTVTDRESNAWGFDYTSEAGGITKTTATSPGPTSTTVYRTSPRAAVSSDDTRLGGGNVVSILDPSNNLGSHERRYEWEANRLKKKTDGYGSSNPKETSMTYFDLGVLKTVTSPSPNVSRSANDPDQLPPGAPISTVTTSFDYNFPGFGIADMKRMTAAQQPDTAKQRVTDFDVNPTTGDLASVTRRWNSDGSLNATRDRTTSFEYYDGSGAVYRVNGPRPATEVADVTEYSDYKPSGLPRTIKDGMLNTRTLDYTPYGSVTSELDRAQHLTLNEYDSRDNLLSSLNAEGEKTSYEYDGNDNLVTETAPLGVQSTAIADDYATKYVFDFNDRMTSMSKPGRIESDPRRVWTTHYNPDGSKQYETDPTQAETHFSYYSDGSMQTVTSPGATSGDAVTDYQYDALGRVTKTTFPEADAAHDRPVEELIYSPAGTVVKRMETQATGAVDRITRFAYDAHGEVLESLGPRANNNGILERQSNAFNAFGETTSVARRLNENRSLQTTFDYDQAGNKILSSQPAADPSRPAAERTLNTTYSYDVLNRLKTQTDPVNPGHAVAFTYFPEGQQESRKDLYQGVARRVIVNAYNDDYTLRSVIATDVIDSNPNTPDPTLATCNWSQGGANTSGYDANNNLVVTRTLKGTSGCAGGQEVKKQTFSYDHRDWVE